MTNQSLSFVIMAYKADCLNGLNYVVGSTQDYELACRLAQEEFKKRLGLYGIAVWGYEDPANGLSRPTLPLYLSSQSRRAPILSSDLIFIEILGAELMQMAIDNRFDMEKIKSSAVECHGLLKDIQKNFDPEYKA